MENIYLRRITLTDKKIIFDMVNDPVTRKNSFSMQSIKWEEHSRWFDEKMDNPYVHIFILMVSDTEAGYIRLETSQDGLGKVSYNIAANFRAKGLGKVLIQLFEQKIMLENILVKQLLMEVKTSNVASQLILEDLGYVREKSSDYYVYTKLVNKNLERLP